MVPAEYCDPGVKVKHFLYSIGSGQIQFSGTAGHSCNIGSARHVIGPAMRNRYLQGAIV